MITYILYYLKKADEALPIIKESLKQNPQDYIALNTMGLICMEMKNSIFVTLF